MRSVVRHLIPVLMLCSFAGAQDFVPGMEVSGFRVPVYEAGELRAQLYGEQGLVLESGEIEITHLKIELFEEGEIVMTVYAPHCFFNRERGEAHSTGAVLIESDMMTIAGEGFRWASDAGRFEIMKQSKVLVKQRAKTDLGDIEL